MHHLFVQLRSMLIGTVEVVDFPVEQWKKDLPRASVPGAGAATTSMASAAETR
jgi:hypothetical protein